MAFVRPTLPELVDRIQADFISRLSLIGALLRRSTVYVLSRVLAGAAHMLHGHLEFLSLQLFPDQSESTFLKRQAKLYGITPTAPDFAKATVNITGTNGSVVPTGTVLQRADGAEYSVDAPVTISAGVGVLHVTSVLAGSDQSLAVAVSLAFESPVAGVASPGAVASIVQDGSDAETGDALRVRVLARLQNPPQGGNDADYVAWSKTVPGVTRVWVSPKELGPGTVVVRFVRDNDGGSIFPDSGEVAAVQAVLNTNAPSDSTPTAIAPTNSVMNVTCHIVPSTSDTQAAVTAELKDMLFRTAIPGGTILLSDIQTAIRIAAGVTDRTLASPAADVTHTTGQLATLGSVTFT